MVLVLVGCGRVGFEPGHDPVDAAAATDGVSSACTAAAGCTAFSCGTSCYQRCASGTLSWGEAEAACLAWGGHLASIERADEAACVATVAAPTWIGLVQDEASAEPGDGWQWLLAGPVSWDNWEADQPDDATPSEDCGRIADGARWADAPCEQALPYLCER